MFKEQTGGWEEKLVGVTPFEQKNKRPKLRSFQFAPDRSLGGFSSRRTPHRPFSLIVKELGCNLMWITKTQLLDAALRFPEGGFVFQGAARPCHR
jgi:hypothetical protein